MYVKAMHSRGQALQIRSERRTVVGTPHGDGPNGLADTFRVDQLHRYLQGLSVDLRNGDSRQEAKGQYRCCDSHHLSPADDFNRGAQLQVGPIEETARASHRK